MHNNKPKTLVPALERAKVARAVRAWLDSYADKPCKRVDFEYLGERGLTLSTIQSAYKTKQFIDGSYLAQYQFHVIYRTLPTNADERLEADEVLGKMAEWCENNLPTLGDNMIAQKVTCTNNAALVARYDNSVEDHQITFTLNYEVINNG